MILVDTGPFVALFDPKDALHQHCRSVLRSIEDPLTTTVPVLTEAFHLLSPGSQGADRLRDFILNGGVSVWFLDFAGIERSFELMEQYVDHPMDLADASLVAAAEALRTNKVFTIDRQDFATYRIRRGHRYYNVDIIGGRLPKRSFRSVPSQSSASYSIPSSNANRTSARVLKLMRVRSGRPRPAI